MNEMMNVALAQTATAVPIVEPKRGGCAAPARATDGFSEELRALALGMVLRLPDQELKAAPSKKQALFAGDGATFRLAQEADIALICDFRCAQSVEYWGLTPTDESWRLFRAETESYVRRTLNERTFFALVERDGDVVAVSGLEVADRMPAISSTCGAERAATVVACYTPVAHRGHGYMGQMLAAWSSMAPLLGIDTLYLESHNASMQHLAEAQGYEHVSDKYRLSLSACSAGEDEAEPMFLPPIAC